MDAAMRARLQLNQTNSNLLLCNLKLSYKYQGSFLQTIKTLVGLLLTDGAPTVGRGKTF